MNCPRCGHPSDVITLHELGRQTARPGATPDTLRAHGAALAAQHGVPVYPKPRPHVLTADWLRAVGAVEVAA